VPSYTYLAGLPPNIVRPGFYSLPPDSLFDSVRQILKQTLWWKILNLAIFSLRSFFSRRLHQDITLQLHSDRSSARASARAPQHTAMATSRVAAAGLLGRQLRSIQTDKDAIPGISCGLVNDNVFEWEVMLMINDDCKYYGGECRLPATRVKHSHTDPVYPTLGGNFRARLSFPPEYPLMPPKMRFETPIFHPNSMVSTQVFFSQQPALMMITPVYPNGDVCISILHPPEEDKYGYESAAERWSPVQTPETILLSVISMLSSPNDESPANVEAATMWREDNKAFKRKVRRCVDASLEA
jgi:ubiquitin-conjugating enzyme E2 G1